MKLPEEVREQFAKAGALGDRKKKAKGGKKGGKTRMAAMTDEERKALAAKAGRASAVARAKKAKGAK